MECTKKIQQFYHRYVAQQWVNHMQNSSRFAWMCPRMRSALSVNAKLSFCLILLLISEASLFCTICTLNLMFSLVSMSNRQAFCWFYFYIIIQGLVTDLRQARKWNEWAENKYGQLAGVTFKAFWIRSDCNLRERTRAQPFSLSLAHNNNHMIKINIR